MFRCCDGIHLSRRSNAQNIRARLFAPLHQLMIRKQDFDYSCKYIAALSTEITCNAAITGIYFKFDRAGDSGGYADEI